MAPKASSSLRCNLSSTTGAAGVAEVSELSAVAVDEFEVDAIVCAGFDEVTEFNAIAKWELEVTDRQGRVADEHGCVQCVSSRQIGLFCVAVGWLVLPVIPWVACHGQDERSEWVLVSRRRRL